jgi:hypothetical protein
VKLKAKGVKFVYRRRCGHLATSNSDICTAAGGSPLRRICQNASGKTT